jgi:hypothetical protein
MYLLWDRSLDVYLGIYNGVGYIHTVCIRKQNKFPDSLLPDEVDTVVLHLDNSFLILIRIAFLCKSPYPPLLLPLPYTVMN